MHFPTLLPLMALASYSLVSAEACNGSSPSRCKPQIGSPIGARAVPNCGGRHGCRAPRLFGRDTEPADAVDDTALASSELLAMTEAAMNATTPEGYELAPGGRSLLAAVFSPAADKGYQPLGAYAPSTCAGVCNTANRTCQGFNIFFQRGGADAPIAIRCQFFDARIDSSMAVNWGDFEETSQFTIVGSNLYNKIEEDKDDGEHEQEEAAPTNSSISINISTSSDGGIVIHGTGDNHTLITVSSGGGGGEVAPPRGCISRVGRIRCPKGSRPT